MKTSLLASFVFSIAIGAQAQTVTLTLQSLGQWGVTGAGKTALADGASLSLPPGSQLDRTFGPGAVVLRIVSHPTFSVAGVAQPILGVGPAAVAFESDDSIGKFVLVVGEKDTIDLPWSVPLDSAGEPVELFLGYDPGTHAGLVGWQGQWQAFISNDSSTLVDVWLAAGDRHAWPLDSVEVFVLHEEEPATGTGSSADALSRSKAQASGSPRLQAAALTLGKSSNPASGSANRPDEASSSAAPVVLDAPKTPPHAPPTLEIFTPPSVRHPGKSGAHAHNNQDL